MRSDLDLAAFGDLESQVIAAGVQGDGHGIGQVILDAHGDLGVGGDQLDRARRQDRNRREGSPRGLGMRVEGVGPRGILPRPAETQELQDLGALGTRQQ